MRLQLFTNSERMRTVSELVKIDVDKHIAEGGTYYDRSAQSIAKRAVLSCMPEIPELLQERVVIESEDGLLPTEAGTQPLEKTDIRRLEGMHVQAVLKAVELQAFRLTTHEFGEDNPIDMYDYDVFAVLQPTYVDPEPSTIVFGEELYVPFRAVTLFEPSDSNAA